MQLPELQRALSRHILSQGDEITDCVASDAILDAVSRLAVYRDGYAIRLTEALDANFPMLHRLLGDEEFSRLARRFIARCPSRHRSIRWYGRELAGFLQQEPPYADQPILAELAHWEWAMTLAFDAEDAEPTPREALQAYAPEEFAALRFKFHPSLRRLDLHWNAPAVWQALTREQAPPAAARAEPGTHWIIWRQQLTTYYRSLGAAEEKAVALACDQGSFGEICEAVAELADDANPALLAAGFLQTWLTAGLIRQLSLA